MFTYIRFTMENSIGTPATVCLHNEDGLVKYEILFPNLGADKAKPRSLGRDGSTKFLRRLKRSGFVEFVVRFAKYGMDEHEGDFWSLDMELPDGMEIHIHGPRPDQAILYPFIQDFAELLDGQFSITQYISPSRVDKLEIEFLFNEIDPLLRDMVTDYDQCDHTENVTVDRSSFTLSYSKRYPAGCFHSNYECKCEQQVRQILDQTTEALKDPGLFDNYMDPVPGSPLLFFNFTFHDGSTAQVRRSLSIDGLRDDLYMEMIDVLFETSLHLLFKDGLFDRRFILHEKGKSSELPFFIVYTEDDEDSLVEGLEVLTQ